MFIGRGIFVPCHDSIGWGARVRPLHSLHFGPKLSVFRLCVLLPFPFDFLLHVNHICWCSRSILVVGRSISRVRKALVLQICIVANDNVGSVSIIEPYWRLALRLSSRFASVLRVIRILVPALHCRLESLMLYHIREVLFHLELFSFWHCGGRNSMLIKI